MMRVILYLMLAALLAPNATALGTDSVAAAPGVPPAPLTDIPTAMPSDAVAKAVPAATPEDVVEDVEEAAGLACRSALEVTLTYWVGDVTDERSGDLDLAATATAEVHRVVQSAGTLVRGLDAVTGPAGELVTTVQQKIPVDVHVTWQEEYIEWEAVEDKVYLAAVAPLPSAEAGPVKTVEVCDDRPLLDDLAHYERGEADGRYVSPTEPSDGWYVRAFTADATAVMGAGEPGRLPFDRGYAIAPAEAMQAAERELDQAFEVWEEHAPSAEPSEPTEDAATTPDDADTEIAPTGLAATPVSATALGWSVLGLVGLAALASIRRR